MQYELASPLAMLVRLPPITHAQYTLRVTMDIPPSGTGTEWTVWLIGRAQTVHAPLTQPLPVHLVHFRGINQATLLQPGLDILPPFRLNLLQYQVLMGRDSNRDRVFLNDLT